MVLTSYLVLQMKQITFVWGNAQVQGILKNRILTGASILFSEMPRRFLHTL